MTEIFIIYALYQRTVKKKEGKPATKNLRNQILGD